MLVCIDDKTKSLLCCPFCHSSIAVLKDGFVCRACRLFFPLLMLSTGEEEQNITYDFRILKPDFAKSQNERQWDSTQENYKIYHHEKRKNDDQLKEYLDAIESVREIYTEEFNLSGSILDVGGEIGTLRHYLENRVSSYINVDPLDSAFDRLANCNNLLRAYPELKKPCNFIIANAEKLPFLSNSFDWIHMRSTIDHFFDPYIAVLESFRCIKNGGRLLIGLSIIDKIENLSSQVKKTKLKSNRASDLKQKIKTVFGVKNIAILYKIKNILLRKTYNHHAHEDEHMFCFTHRELIELCTFAGWKLEKEHWQKAPFEHCLYVSFTASKNVN